MFKIFLYKISTLIIVLQCQIFADPLGVKLKSSQQFEGVVPLYVEKEFLFLLTSGGEDSIGLSSIQEVRYKKNKGLLPFTNIVLFSGYITLFYYLLESMYESAPFSIPQFIGVFTVFGGVGTGGGYLYAIITDRKPTTYQNVNIEKLTNKEKAHKIRTILYLLNCDTKK